MTPTYEEVRDWAIEAATTWALDPDGADRLRVGDLDPAWALRVEAFNLLLPVAAAAAGVASDMGTPGLFGAVKRRGLDRAARAWVLRAQAAASGTRAPRPGAAALPVLFLAEFATPSMLEPMLLVARALPAGTWLAAGADPRSFRAFGHLGPRVPLVLSRAEERSILRTAAAAADAAWDRIVARPPALNFGGTDLTAASLRSLEPLVLRSLPWLVVEREAIERLVDRHRPRWIVVASDQHRLGRAVVDVAHGSGTRVLVLQHGLPQYVLGYVPVVADAVATWSESDDAWFLARGTAPERLQRLGNPRLDGIAGQDRGAAGDQAAERLRIAGRPRLVVVLSPNDRRRNADLVDLAMGLLAPRPEAAIVLKLHPGDGRWGAVRAQVRAAGPLAERVRIVRRDPLQPLLAWADAVLLHRSTVAVEALAAGTPVIVAAVGASSPADALPEALELPVVATAAELAVAVAAVTGDTARRAFIAARRDAVQRSTGPLDGGSAARIARFLLGAA
jgi:glycosyltransferase involved in cell wall biosynthesis